MDAWSIKPHTDTQPPRPMDASTASHSRVVSTSSVKFNTRNVTRADNPPCKLTVYLEYGHSFVRLENKDREVDIARGLYPTKAVEQGVPEVEIEEPDGFERAPLYGFLATGGIVKSAGSKPEGVISSAIGSGDRFYQLSSMGERGSVIDEVISYRQFNGIDDIPKVTFFISQKEALEVEKYISQYSDACEKKEDSCAYQLIGFNCVDFAQEAFSKTGYPGHYIQYFTPSLLGQGVGYATLYAGSYHPVIKTTASIGGTLMLAALVVEHTVPKLKETVRRVGSWMCGWVWPEQQAVAATQVDESQLKQLHNSVQSSNLSCETFWENYKQRDAKAKQLISDSVDLQARFYDVDTLIKRKGYNGSHQSYIFQELQSIQDGFTEFFRQATDMKNVQNSRQ
ncbi:hypothetical protein [Endozoicomonas sp. 4G]|uniref:hypothetical protein n=1 Tax=Endozoicomonas sp. 4G TaxID=2872754 RepID=UPI002078E15C|nr:hypothetical protein [Endozoicomonas sp. 4G]